MSDRRTVLCKSCGAKMFWLKTERGKMMPLDAEPDPAGNIVILDGLACAFRPDLLFDTAELRYIPHHATCPQGREWRRKEA